MPGVAVACAVLVLSGCGTPGGGYSFNDPPFDEQVRLEDLYAEAETGSSIAMAHLGWRYDTGRGAPANPIKAAQWYQLAAAEGHSLAQNNLGCLFRDGKGTIQDYAQAAKWFRQAARQGNDHARNNLGWLHEHGLGVPRNFREAANRARDIPSRKTISAAFCVTGAVWSETQLKRFGGFGARPRPRTTTRCTTWA